MQLLSSFPDRVTGKNKTDLLKAASALDDVYEQLAKKSANNIARAKLGTSDLEQFLIDITVAGTQLASDAAANALLPGSGIALKGARSFGDASQEARLAGANVGQQIAYGGLTAGKDVILEPKFRKNANIRRQVWCKNVILSQIVRQDITFLKLCLEFYIRVCYTNNIHYEEMVVCRWLSRSESIFRLIA